MAVLPSALRSGEDAKVHTKRANEGEANLLEASLLSPILACFARPTKTAMLPQATGKVSSTAADMTSRKFGIEALD